MIDRLPKEDVVYYETADDLVVEDDIIETDIRVLGWNKKFRIRALNFGQMMKINKHATIRETNKELGVESGEIDNELWTYWTIVEGVTRPKFKIEQAKRLCDSNGEFVKILADEIWNIGRVSKKAWDEYIEEIKVANRLAEEAVAKSKRNARSKK
jgi:hypothetical protein